MENGQTDRSGEMNPRVEEDTDSKNKLQNIDGKYSYKGTYLPRIVVGCSKILGKLTKIIFFCVKYTPWHLLILLYFLSLQSPVNA